MNVGHRTVIDPTVEISPNVDFTVGDGSYIGPDVHIVGSGTVKFGDYCKIHAGCFINVGHGGHVTFGHNCWFGEQTVLDGAGGLTGGNNVGAGIGSQLYTHIAHGDVIEGCLFESRSAMVLEDDVWFVGQCFVSPIHAGEKSIALLGSVITSNMTPRGVYAGNPGRDITDRIGSGWTFRSPKTKLKMLQARIEEYCALFPERAKMARSCIVPCLKYPRKPDTTISYFNSSTRKYTKRLTEVEFLFMSWLTSYKGRFTPED
jgi:acetyltransferase-like isoleucine patch superfamily enzyme